MYIDMCNASLWTLLNIKHRHTIYWPTCSSNGSRTNFPPGWLPITKTTPTRMTPHHQEQLPPRMTPHHQDNSHPDDSPSPRQRPFQDFTPGHFPTGHLPTRTNSPLGQLPSRTTPCQDIFPIHGTPSHQCNSPLGQLPARTFPHGDTFPSGQLPTWTTPY